METETKTAGPDLRDNPMTGLYHLSFGDGTRTVLAPAELQAVVQQAYDRFGILAEPSIETEAARTLETETDAEDTFKRSFAQAWGESMRGRS